MLDNVKMVSYNVNGLRDMNKRREMFAYLKMLKSNVILLQETHSSPEIEQVWNAEWGQKRYYSHGNSMARGTAILFSRNLQVKVKDISVDSVGRWLILEIVIGEIECLLVSVYGPNEDKAEFYMELFQNIEIKEELPIILGGDLNTVLNLTQDYRGRNNECPNHSRKRETIHNYMESKELEDVWRIYHPDEYVFTFRRDNPVPMSSHLDYFLVSRSLLSRIQKAEIKPRYKSDHARLEIIINCEEHPRGRGLWKFNCSYLKDKDFVDLMNEKTKSFFEERKEMDPIKKWETFKYEVKSEAQEFSIKKAQAKNRLIELLEHKLAKLDTKLRQTEEKEKEKRYKILKDIRNTEEFLETEHEEKTKQAMFRSKCRYYLEGEKNTKYFLNLEKIRNNSKVIAALKSEEGIVISDPEEILKEEREFFKRLYRKENEGSLNINNITDNKLSQQD